MNEPDEERPRTVVCPVCGYAELALVQNTDALKRSVRTPSLFSARGFVALFNAALSTLLRDVPVPHLGPCGFPCDKARPDGVTRHTGPDCAECKWVFR